MPIAHGKPPLHAFSRPSAARRIALAGGGTAGHVYPALAIAAAYRTALPEAAMLFLGTADGPEGGLVRAHGEAFAALPAAPIAGTGLAGRMRALGALLGGVRRATRLLRQERIDCVIGLGGYVSAGALLAARRLGIATVVHEANAVAGIANRWLGRVVDAVLLADGTAAPGFPAAKIVVTGMPVRAAMQRTGAGAPRRAPDPACCRVLVCGGSQGSPFLNARVPAALARLRDRGLGIMVRHVAGDGGAGGVRTAYEAAGVLAEVTAYADDISAAYAWADVAIVCAGAGTLAELAAVALPALLVPLGTAALDHQRANARAFAAATGVPWIAEDEWDDGQVAVTLAATCEPAQHARMVAALREHARPDAGASVVAACERLLATRR